jgi:glycosyltransferase involved in cell wall biosynthesis
MPKLSVVLPVYYNEGSLSLLFDELRQVELELLQRNVQLELIFVDDGSGDNSLRELLKIKQQRDSTRVIKLTRNFGAVHASKAGMQFVTGDCFTILAADLQDPPSLVLEMAQKWLNGAKYVVCARAERNDPAGSKVFAAIYYKLLRFLVVPNYPTGGYDLALMDKVFLTYLRDSSKNINTPLFAYWLGFEPVVIHYERRERVHGKSRWTFSKRFNFFVDSILGFSIVPIRLISMIGIVVSLVSFGYGTIIVINAVRGMADVRGFPTLVALMSFLLGLIIVMLGVIGEYIWRIFDEVNKRPESVIDEIF